MLRANTAKTKQERARIKREKNTQKRLYNLNRDLRSNNHEHKLHFTNELILFFSFDFRYFLSFQPILFCDHIVHSFVVRI